MRLLTCQLLYHTKRNNDLFLLSTLHVLFSKHCNISNLPSFAVGKAGDKQKEVEIDIYLDTFKGHPSPNYTKIKSQCYCI